MMARREVFPHDTPPSVFRTWLAKAAAAEFHLPRRLPIVRPAPAGPLLPLPSLFEALPVQRQGEPPVAQPEPEVPARPQPPAPGTPLDQVLLAHFSGAITPPSPLAMKRRERKAEREAAAVAARVSVADPPARGPSPEDVAYVQAAILDILPKGWPSYAQEVLSIRKDRGVWTCRLRLFDGEIGTLRLSGQPGAHGYGWEVGLKDKRALHFDDKAWAWVRVNESEP